MNEEAAARRKAKRGAPYRNLPDHKARMIERRAGQNLRVGWTQRNPDVRQRVQQFCTYMQKLNHKNGVGSPKARLRFLEREEAAA